MASAGQPSCRLWTDNRRFLALSGLLGTSAFFLHRWFAADLFDPLVLSLILGIVVRTAAGGRWRSQPAAGASVRALVLLGVVFYAAHNLNFTVVARVPAGSVILTTLVMLTYCGTVLLLGRLLGQRDRITFLIATGSAICGASAIAITAPAVDAESDDVSISLLAVTLAALIGLFLLLPFLGTLLRPSGDEYGLMAGAVLQFTGMVREAVTRMPWLPTSRPAAELAEFALSIKALRYLGLLFAIPLFASLIRRRLFIPRYLWFFLGAGVIGTALSLAGEEFHARAVRAWLGPVYQLTWSVALAAIGLQADVHQLLSDRGVKGFWMAVGGLAAALVTFGIGVLFIPWP